MIAIIDYGVGNLFSLARSFSFIGVDCVVTSDPDLIRRAEKVVLPGVGAFADAMAQLEKSGLIPVLAECVRAGKPLLGICLGMQLLFEYSLEFGETRGLSFLPGGIHPLDCAPLKVPHMGWNCLRMSEKESPLLKNTQPCEFVYFVHSFYATNCDAVVDAYAEYGQKVPAVVSRANVFGCQFHPEKSGETGLRILKAFSEL